MPAATNTARKGFPEPVAVAVDLTDQQPPTGLSPSSMGRYSSCPLAYYFYAIARISEPVSEQSALGRFVHKVLERLLALPADQRTLASALHIAGEVRATFCAEDDFVGLGLGTEAARNWAWRAREAIEAYFRLEDPSKVRVQGLERWITASVGGVPVRGSLDRLESDDQDRLVIADYKTGKVPSLGWGVARMEQLVFYCLMVEAATGQRPSHVKLVFVNANEPVVIKGSVTPARLEATRAAIVETWQSVQADLAASTFTAVPSRLCDFCSHRPYCPAWQGDLASAPAGTRNKARAGAAAQPRLPAMVPAGPRVAVLWP